MTYRRGRYGQLMGQRSPSRSSLRIIGALIQLCGLSILNFTRLEWRGLLGWGLLLLGFILCVIGTVTRSRRASRDAHAHNREPRVGRLSA